MGYLIGTSFLWKDNGKEAAYLTGRGVWATSLQETLVHVLGALRG